MNKTEHLLVCLSEECSEVIKAVSKALRFGLDDGYPNGETTNFQDIAEELNDLKAILQLLADENIDFEKLYNTEKIGIKKLKVLNFMSHAINRGKLTI